MRQVILDTETTGMHIEAGNRIIEVACVEMIERRLTGRYFHEYLNPMCEIEEGAQAVHGITKEFLQDKPLFEQIVEPFIEFISGAELIIHNAPFDLAFLNHELHLLKTNLRNVKKITDVCTVLDTLVLARQLHVGQRNSLDALCKRYGVDHSKRELHGALLDANLLAQVYLAMTRGQTKLFEDHPRENDALAHAHQQQRQQAISRAKLHPIDLSSEDLREHEAYLQHMKARGKCLWLAED